MPGRKEEIEVPLQLPIPELINQCAPDGGVALASVRGVNKLEGSRSRCLLHGGGGGGRRPTASGSSDGAKLWGRGGAEGGGKLERHGGGVAQGFRSRRGATEEGPRQRRWRERERGRTREKEATWDEGEQRVNVRWLRGWTMYKQLLPLTAF